MPTMVHNRPGRLRLLFLEPKSLTREKTLSRLGFSQLPLVLLGLLTQRQAFDFSRSLACLFCLMRELAIAAAMASLAAFWKQNFQRSAKRISRSLWIQTTGFREARCPGTRKETEAKRATNLQGTFRKRLWKSPSSAKKPPDYSLFVNWDVKLDSSVVSPRDGSKT